MKICICTNTRPHEGGLTAHINTIALGFRKSGHQVDILTVFGTQKERKTYPRLTHQTDNLLRKYHFLTLPILILCQFILMTRLLANYLRKRYHFISAQDVIAVNAARPIQLLFGCPIIFTNRGILSNALTIQNKIKPNSFSTFLINRMEQRAFQRANAIFATSQYITDYVKKYLPQNIPLQTIKSPVNEEVFYFDPQIRKRARQQLGLSNQFVILCAARLAKIKGVIYPIKALKELLKKDKDFMLIYAGDGPEKSKITNLISQYNLSANVILLGTVPYQKMQEIYNLADVLIIPSITQEKKQETFPIASLEAINCDLPVVASQTGGIPEIIKDGWNGLLFPEKNIRAMVQAIWRIKNESGLRDKIIANGRQFIQDYHSSKVAQRVIELFQQCQSSKKFK